MVSFSCEVCNDVLTKKKVDGHRSASCRGATFTCLDCMQHFIGTEYRSHTSCVSEAQKYQGALYNERKPKSSKGLSSSVHRSASIPRKAYVEDVPEDLENGGGTVVIVEAPPPAPSPPPPPPPRQSQPQQQAIPAVNVFDFLVNEDTPNGSRTTINIPDEGPERMSVGQEILPPPPPPPVIFEASPRRLDDISERNESRETFGESQYAENGYHYGQGPVPVAHRHERYTYLTPASHRHRLAAPRDEDRDDGRYRNGDVGPQHSKHRKRKRIQVEELQLDRIRSHSVEGDQIMTDAPPVLHTGLTGGLKGLLTRTAPDYPQSPGYPADNGGAGAADRSEPSPGSPLKRSKRHSVGNPMTALVSTRRRSTTDGHHHVPRLHRHHSSSHRRHHRHHRHSRPHDDETGERPPRKLKTIKYRGEEDGESQNEGQQQQNNQQQLVLYRSRVELFMSFVTKGPESEKGCSMNKALKRYHRERLVGGGVMSKVEEEKELWKSLRVKKNERGEIVLFAAGLEEAGMMSS